MTFTNEDRELAIKEFSSIYGETNLKEMLNHIPDALSDVDGEEFDLYFDFIQLMFSLKSDIKQLNEQELYEKLEMVKSLAKKFNYPVQNLEDFYGN